MNPTPVPTLHWTELKEIHSVISPAVGKLLAEGDPAPSERSPLKVATVFTRPMFLGLKDEMDGLS